jgi:hypothetical protein
MKLFHKPLGGVGMHVININEINAVCRYLLDAIGSNFTVSAKASNEYESHIIRTMQIDDNQEEIIANFVRLSSRAYRGVSYDVYKKVLQEIGTDTTKAKLKLMGLL